VRPIRSAIVVVFGAAIAAIGLLPGQIAVAHTPHDDIADVEASPAFAQDHTLLAISNNRVLRSTSASPQWTEATRGLSGKTLSGFAFAPSDPRVVYLSSRNGGVYRSADGGLSWSTTNTPPAMVNVSAVAVSPASADVVVAALAPLGGVYRTIDGGTTWTGVPQYVQVNAMTFVPGFENRLLAGDARGGVYLSDDAGATFRRVPLGEPDDDDVVTAIAASPAGAGSVVVAGTSTGESFVSTDGGGSWSRGGTIAAGDRTQSLTASPAFATDHTLWASSWHSGAHRSEDGGHTWTVAADGLTTDPQADDINLPQFRALSFAADTNGETTLYLGGYDGLFVWNEPTQRWSEIQTQSEYITGLAVSPDYQHDGTVAVGTYVKGVFVSRDHGSTFEPEDRGLGHAISEGNKLLPLRRMHKLAFSPAYATDDTIFAATWDRFVKSTDGGRTWKQILVEAVPPAQTLRQFVVAVSPDYARDGTIYLGTQQGIVYRSTQRGDEGTWSRVGSVGSRVRTLALSPAFASDRTLVAGTEGGVRVSRDAARSWTRTGPATESLVAISPDFARDETVFAGTADGLFVSRDGARTWTDLTGELPPPATVAAVAVSPAFATDQTVLVSVAGQGLLRSTDAGRSFQPTGETLREHGLVIADFDRPTSEPLQFSPNYAEDRTVYGYAQEQLVRSTDGGTTWELLALPSASSFTSRWTDPGSGGGGSRTVVIGIAIAFALVAVLTVGAFALKRRSN
jgi:photosystem II stability/assembly factor-like uncharacterized protein